MKNILYKSLCVFSLFVLFLEACNKQDNSPSPNVEVKPAPDSSLTPALPKPDHVVIVVEENHSDTQIIGSASSPYINALSTDLYSANFTESYAITHPSQPNYLDLYSGSNQGVTNDDDPSNDPFITPNLGRQLIDAGRSYSTYSESLPYAGYNGDNYGAYARKHNPAANWMGTGINQIAPSTNQPFTAFPGDYTKLSTVSIVIPDKNNDMHDGSISTGDLWLRNYLDNYIQWSKTHNSLFILTFDEDDSKDDNRIVTIFCGSMVKSGQYSTQINHYNVLRTIEDMYGLPYAGNASNAKAIDNCWK